MRELLINWMPVTGQQQPAGINTVTDELQDHPVYDCAHPYTHVKPDS